ncbi:MAG: prepilin-type N-terminal cleavage/methylation domain-containing protein [Candidatus Moraniibacteriota bacterium]
MLLPDTIHRKHGSGFTLIEMMIAMFLFVILIVAVSQIFSAAFSGYRDAKAAQRDLETAQFAINTIAKELRTSTVVSSSGSQSTVKFYDYSQSTCFQYRVSGGNLQVASSGAPSDASACDSSNLSSFTTIASGILSGRFFVTLSEPASGTPPTGGTVGKVTISLEIGEGSAHQARIQTSASLRDYGYVGLLNLNP